MAEALRVTFTRTNGTISLQDLTQVTKRAPASDRPADRTADDATGMWLDIRDGDDVVHRRQIGPLFPESYEVHTGDPDSPVVNAPRTRPYEVQVQVPATTTPAGRVVLWERRAATGQETAEDREAVPREIVHVDHRLYGEGRPAEPGKGE